MKLLAIDTATEACSAALYVDGEISECYELAPRRHGELILSMVERLLVDAALTLKDLDALAFGRGPGGFTGIRIAAGVVQGLAFGSRLPVAPVSTLAAIAHGVWRRTGADKVIAGIDARMQEVYWGIYQFDLQGLIEQYGEEVVCSPSEVPLPPSPGWVGAGTAWLSYQQPLQQRLQDKVSEADPAVYPHAHDVALLGVSACQGGRTVIAEEALPVYLRDKVVSKR